MLMTLLAAALAAAEPVPACTATSPANQVALVELYTSQGCSSCPPADRWLSQLAARYRTDEVVPLALHVDYWDYIGWRDPYGQREFSARQRALAILNSNRTVYTPGVFMQSQEFPQWSSASDFDAAVGSITRTSASVRIMLRAQLDGSAVSVRAQATPLPSAGAPRLFVALIENGLATRIRAGENRGETLKNDRVVRRWSGPLPLVPDPVQWPVAPSDRARHSIVGFVEDASGRVLQVVELPLGRC